MNKADHITPVRVAILLSGRGSNARAILKNAESGSLPSVEPVAICSNKPNAEGLALANEFSVMGRAFPQAEFGHGAERDKAMASWLNEQDAQLLVLAGYNRILSPAFFQTFSGAILNIHPSLLPKYGGVGMVGKAVHQAVLDAKESESGCTVHQVTEVVDGGPVLGQAIVSVCSEDTVEQLAARVLEQEHQLYSEVIQEVALALQNGASVQLLECVTPVMLDARLTHPTGSAS